MSEPIPGDAQTGPAPPSRLRAPLEFACGALLVLLTLLMAANVLARYVFAYPLTWADEVVSFAFVWLCFLSAAYAIEERGHFVVSFLIERLPVRWRRRLLLATGVLVSLVLAVLVVTGFRLMMLVNGQTSSSLEVPMSIAYASLPVGSLLMLWFELRHLAAAWRQR